MRSKVTPIKQKLVSMILVVSCAVLVLTSGAFLTYELLTFRNSMVAHISTLATIIANNSNAALKFSNHNDAQEVLNGLKAEPHIVAASLYSKDGKIFVSYPADALPDQFPQSPGLDGRRFANSHLITFEPVMKDGDRVGTLYLDSDMGALYQRFRPYSGIAAVVMIASMVLAYVMSSILQRQISRPLLALADTAKAISERQDYSVRAPVQGKDEFGLLTEAFNNMLEQIHQRDLALQEVQQKLKDHAEELEHRVTERTARLSDTVAELESFSYSISHDMRAPLRAMTGYSAYVTGKYGEKLGPEGMGYLDRINRAGKRLDALIQDILTYSRLSRAQLDLHPVDLDKLVDDILQQYPGLQKPSGNITVVKPLMPVIGHEAALTQVISNLLGNAVKFIVPGKNADVRVRTEQLNGEVRLWVEDDGIGIAPKDQQRIFGIFERIYPEKTYDGTGIGLSIVKKGVERMGGHCGVESELDKGSRFWVQLKRA